MENSLSHSPPEERNLSEAIREMNCLTYVFHLPRKIPVKKLFDFSVDYFKPHCLGHPQSHNYEHINGDMFLELIHNSESGLKRTYFINPHVGLFETSDKTTNYIEIIPIAGRNLTEEETQEIGWGFTALNPV
jgi:hypothetical protein